MSENVTEQQETKSALQWRYDAERKRHCARLGHFWADIYELGEKQFEGRFSNIKMQDHYEDLEMAKKMVEKYAIYKIEQAFDLVLQIKGAKATA